MEEVPDYVTTRGPQRYEARHSGCLSAGAGIELYLIYDAGPKSYKAWYCL